MKSNKLILLPLAVAMYTVSPAVLAQKAELDMTMTIVEEDQQPAGFVQKIQLPSPAELGTRDDVTVERTLDNIADQVREDSGALTDEAVGTVTDDLKDVLSIDGVENLPGDIIDNLSEDLPLLDDDLLPDLPDLPLGSPQDDVMQDTVQEAVDVIDAMPEDTVDEVKDAGSEVGKTLEETRKLIP